MAEPTDKEFCQFLTMAFGYRAAVKVMKSYYRLFLQCGMKWNIPNILNRWAPKSENNTDGYIRRVTELMGREPGEWSLADPNTAPGRMQLAMMMAAMTCVESGCPPSAVPVGSLNTGFVFAGLGDPKLTSGWW